MTPKEAVDTPLLAAGSFIKMPRLGSLSTSGKDGKVNVGVFGSPKMTHEKRVVMGLRKNKTFVNLQENPFAVYMIMEPGKTVTEWRGLRVYPVQISRSC